MNDYDKKILEFFSTEENFINMSKIASHFPNVKRLLLEEFWQLVKNMLIQRNSDHGNKWQIQLTGAFGLPNSKLMLYKRHWANLDGVPIIAIAFERMYSDDYPFYGLFLNNNIEGFNHEGIREFAANLETAKDFYSRDDKDWPLWLESGVDFKDVNDYVKILPVNRTLLAEDFANKLFQMAMNLESDLEKMSKMKI